MKIVGHVLIGLNQQRAIAPGCAFEMPLSQFRQTVKWKARIGDLVWVKEPWCMLMPMGLAVPGHFIGLHDRISEAVRKAKRKVEFHSSGHGLHRMESRFTLEIMGFTPDAGSVRFLVHQQQIDSFMNQRRAVA